MRELELRGQKACVAPVSLEVRNGPKRFPIVLRLKHLHVRSGGFSKV